ncbi:protein kinase [Streptomyces sp. NPDC048629]|uniref:serine/threonine-protein kinase n=1 Tax=Streptomyces sp. NPDC048629 TaxID=3154824 RepID=UPI0034465F3D
MLQPLDAAGVRRVGPYVTVAVIGSGGMGSVHLARRAEGDGGAGGATWGDAGAGSAASATAAQAGPALAAVKTIHDGLGIDDGFRIRFRREAEAARAVRGPYTAALLDADPDGNPPWLATEYVPGPSLAEAVTRLGPLPLPVLRALGADLARALRTVHGARLLHRDLKPANVLLSADGPKLIDFGIARAFDGTVLTAAGQVIGTPGFMSPEQVAGQDDIGPASDVFALGGLLCWAATGRGPFDDPELAAVFSRISGGRADLAGLPDELREVVSACLAVDPAGRPTTDDLVRALDARAAGERPGAVLARREGPFPWSPGVRELIGAYEAETRRLLASAPPAPPEAPRTPPAGGGPVPPMPPAGGSPVPPMPGPGPAYVTPPSPVTAPSPNARTRRRATVAATAVAGALALVAGLLVGLGYFDDGGDRDGAGRGPSPSAFPAPPPVDGVESVSAQGAVGSPHTLSYPAPAGDGRDVPRGWKPWRVEDKDGASSCVLQDDLLICAGGTHATAYRAADGSTVWRSPNSRMIPGMSHDRVYLGEGEGVVVAQRSDGKPVGRWPGAAGFVPTRALAAGGVVYVGYLGDAGIGTAGEMMFRAYRESDGSMLWESTVHNAYPWGLTLLGGKLYIPVAGPLTVLDPKTGKTLAEKEVCLDPVVGPTGEMHCSSTMGGKVQDPIVAAGPDGVVIAQAGSEVGEVRLYAAIESTGQVLWSRPIDTAGEFVGLGNTLVVGDRVVVATASGVASYGLKDGKPLAAPVPATWRIPQDDPNAQPTFLAAGDVFFLTWGGSVVSARIPR